MIARKIDAMHAIYGFLNGKQCKDCPHLVEGYYHDKKLIKCSVYGMTHSEATDWRKKWTACGCFIRPFPEEENRIFDQIKHMKLQLEKPIEGQITMEDMLNDQEL